MDDVLGKYKFRNQHLRPYLIDSNSRIMKLSPWSNVMLNVITFFSLHEYNTITFIVGNKNV